MVRGAAEGLKLNIPSPDYRDWGILLKAVLQADPMPSDTLGWKADVVLRML